MASNFNINISSNNSIIEPNTDINGVNIKLIKDLEKIKLPNLGIESGTPLVKRKVVGGVLTGTGITGLVGAGIAGTLVAVKVGGTGVVAALAGLVGAAAAPWVAIAIAGTAVAALIALTVTGIYLLATKPDNKDLEKMHNDVIQKAKNRLTKTNELANFNNQIENLKEKIAASEKRANTIQNSSSESKNEVSSQIKDKEKPKEELDSGTSRVQALNKKLAQQKIDIGEINKEHELDKNKDNIPAMKEKIDSLKEKARELKKEIRDLDLQLRDDIFNLASAAGKSAGELENQLNKVLTFGEKMSEQVDCFNRILTKNSMENRINKEKDDEIKNEKDNTIIKKNEKNNNQEKTNRSLNNKDIKEEKNTQTDIDDNEKNLKGSNQEIKDKNDESFLEKSEFLDKKENISNNLNQDGINNNNNNK